MSVLFLLLISISLVSSFSLFKYSKFNNIHRSLSLSSSLSMNTNENALKNIIVSGFVSKATGFFDSFVFSKIYEKVTNIRIILIFTDTNYYELKPIILIKQI